jgi:hypothetical protein
MHRSRWRVQDQQVRARSAQRYTYARASNAWARARVGVGAAGIELRHGSGASGIDVHHEHLLQPIKLKVSVIPLFSCADLVEAEGRVRLARGQDAAHRAGLIEPVDQPGELQRGVTSNLAMMVQANGTLLRTAEERGVSTELLTPFMTLMERRLADGHGHEGTTGVVDLLLR